jgi:NADH dehydrogenase/NADH:ubiquinone oxidoreductase subunit G
MKLINLKINDKDITVEAGKNILDYCIDLGALLRLKGLTNY